MNKIQSDNLLNALCLHDNDNILITLKNLNSGMVLNEYGITICLLYTSPSPRDCQ